jgi:dTDP-4-amino-4,6-dideoxygalactose transaminase
MEAISHRVQKVPLNDTRRQYSDLAEELDEAVRRVMAGGWYILGREHDAFEEELAAYCQTSHAVAVANGTDALELSLRALGCGPGDEVITAANAGGYTTTACLLVGVTPVFADIDPDSLEISPASVAEALTGRTKAVVVTHLYGKMADIEGVQRAVAGRGIRIIEDCAQAHGAMRGGERAGSFGDLAAFSFYPTKNLGAMGDGGAIVTDCAELADRLRQLRQYGWDEKYHAAIAGGRNSRMDEIQAAILRRKLPRLDHWNERRRAIVTQYRHAAANTSLRIVHEEGSDYVAHLCVARHPDRDGLRRFLEARGVSTAIHYPVPDHRQPSLEGLPWRKADLGVTEAAVDEIVTLPCFAEMTQEEIDHVCDALRAAT